MKPVLGYRSVNWTLTQMTQREILRGFYGPIHDKGRWHSRWKSETYNLYKYLSITDNIKIRRTEWAGRHNKMKLSQKRFLIGNFITQDQLENQQKMGGCRPEGNITDPRNKKMEENSKNTETNGGVYLGRPGHSRSWRATDGWIVRTSFQMPCTNIFRRRAMQWKLSNSHTNGG